MSLTSYRQKRDFRNTTEPHGNLKKLHQKKLSFFVQRHNATHLHYDFRLELEGVLKSWAVPKGPSLDPSVKRLAVHVEDHPLEYGTFEGEIPAHQYGAGQVVLWDAGEWIPFGDPLKSYRNGKLTFSLVGQKLTGVWALVRMGKPRAGKDYWLLVKERDNQARSGDEAAITTLQPEGVATSSSKRNISRARAAPGIKYDKRYLEKIDGAVRLKIPDFIRPQLATLSNAAPIGSEWLSEVKFDGYRALCRIHRGSAKLFTRTGLDWTAKWQNIAESASHLQLEQAWLDGEVVALNNAGMMSFDSLQKIFRGDTSARLVYYIFDLLYLNGYDLREVPLLKRKMLLKLPLSQASPTGPLQYSDHVVGDAQRTYEAACTHELEGILAKRTDGRYTSRRSLGWLKIKCHQRQEFIIVGFTDPSGSREKFGALLLGVNDEQKKTRYVGKVGTGLSRATIKELAELFAQLSSDVPTVVDPPTGRVASRIHWLKPRLIAEVRFAQWTAGGRLRQASFIGLRADKQAHEITREKSISTTDLGSSKRRGDTGKISVTSSVPPENEGQTPAVESAGDIGQAVAGVPLTHPTRLIFPEIGINKLQFARYYEKVSKWILPHLSHRPLTIVRCPENWRQCFYQRHQIDRELRKTASITRNGSPDLLVVDSLQTLIRFVQMGVLEFHTWGARADRLDRPDRMIFDLDPAPNLPCDAVIEGAFLIKTVLDELGLVSFVKTTGGKGLHVIVPLRRDRTWDEVKAFSRAIAIHVASLLPDRFTAKMTKTRRSGKIYIDFLRNAPEATAVAAYSTRALSAAPISTPISWDELSDGVHSNEFTIINMEERLSRLKHDPWKDFLVVNQRISLKMLEMFGLIEKERRAGHSS